MTERYELDPAHTQIGFSAKHLGFTTVRGTFQSFSGWIEGDRGTLDVAGEVSVDVASATTGQPKRDGHLQSSDFFEVETYPRATYRITGARKVGEGAYRIDGELTLKATTRPLSLNAVVSGEIENPFQPGGRIVSVTATGELNRMDFGVNWDGLAGAVPLAGHVIKLEIEAELASAVQSLSEAS
ncbi:MAG: YceI family protein [Candidatus Dormibacterales bacterium]